MAEYFVDPENGSDAADGLTTSTPWKLIPGQTGANVVAANDIINIKNGTTTTLQIQPTQNGLTYRGYGVATNVLYLTLPKPGNPMNTYQRKVVRLAGSHEGMWKIANCASTTVISFGTRTNVTIEDCAITANTSQTSTVVAVGFSSSTVAGATLRRCYLEDAPSVGINAYTRNVTIEYCKITRCQSDGIDFSASASNSLRTSSNDILRYCDISYVGLGLTNGDGFQTVVSSGQYLGNLYIDSVYVFKDARIKQSCLLSDGTNGITLRNFHFKGTDLAHSQIGLETIKGNVRIENGYINGGQVDNAAIRFVTSSGNALGTGAVLTLRNIVVEGSIGSGLFTAATATAATVDGTINITNCVYNGTNMQTLSFSAGISFHPGGQLTIGGNFKINLRNNIINPKNGYTLALPPLATVSGTPANYVIINNAFDANATFFFSGGSSRTYNEFLTDHTTAVNNQAVTSFQCNSDYSPTSSSTLKYAGIFVETSNDLCNKMYNNPPSIAPIEFSKSRGTR